MKIILGSSSILRRQIMNRSGIPYVTMSADIDEKAIGDREADADTLTLLLATAKADALVPQIKEPALLITSDQVALIDGRITEKPLNVEEGRARLSTFHERRVETVTTVVVTHVESGRRLHATHHQAVVFTRIPIDAIEKALARGLVLKTAGGFDIDDPDLKDYTRVPSNRSSVQGLPIDLTLTLLCKLSWM